MNKSTTLGMQTFDQALLQLYEAGEISYEDALHHADAAHRRNSSLFLLLAPCPALNGSHCTCRSTAVSRILESKLSCVAMHAFFYFCSYRALRET